MDPGPYMQPTQVPVCWRQPKRVAADVLGAYTINQPFVQDAHNLAPFLCSFLGRGGPTKTMKKAATVTAAFPLGQLERTNSTTLTPRPPQNCCHLLQKIRSTEDAAGAAAQQVAGRRHTTGGSPPVSRWRRLKAARGRGTRSRRGRQEHRQPALSHARCLQRCLT